MAAKKKTKKKAAKKKAAKKKTDAFSVQIGATVRTLRYAKGITTTALAKRVGISQAQISRLETGKQGFRSGTLVKVAKAVGVKPFRLFMTESEWAKYQKVKD